MLMCALGVVKVSACWPIQVADLLRPLLIFFVCENLSLPVHVSYFKSCPQSHFLTFFFFCRAISGVPYSTTSIVQEALQQLQLLSPKQVAKKLVTEK